jgi:CheY-like chemotaxis protein
MLTISYHQGTGPVIQKKMQRPSNLPTVLSLNRICQPARALGEKGMHYDEVALLNRADVARSEDEVPFFFLDCEKQGACYRCLVVDDDPVILRLVAEMMSDLEYLVDVAADGLQALRALSSQRYDLVVTDLDMPVLSGYHLAENIKSKTRNTKVIIMTGHCRYELAELMRSGPVDAWIFKPFDMDDFYKVLDDLELPSSQWQQASGAAMRL